MATREDGRRRGPKGDIADCPGPGRSLEQGREPRLLEMVIGRESIGDAVFSHDLERCAVSDRPGFVGPGKKQLNGSAKQFGRHRDYGGVRILTQDPKESGEPASYRRCRQEIAHLKHHELSCYDGLRHVVREVDGRLMIRVIGNEYGQGSTSCRRSRGSLLRGTVQVVIVILR